jgi:ABC-2 type transport system ATP-binding protein
MVMANELAVETTGLTKHYGADAVVNGVDLRVERGRVFALLGPNGAGKTTIVRILSTLVKADGGTAKVAGFDVSSDAHRVRRVISLTGQYAALDATQTGEENLVMMGRVCGLSRGQARLRAHQLLERLDLESAARRRVALYSGGMRRRLDLAAGLVGRPSVLFLDEPTTGLDVRSRNAVWEITAGLVAGGVSVFLTTQYLEEADRLADRIGMLDAGRVVAEGSPRDLKDRVAPQRLDLTFVDDDAFAAAAGYLGSRAVKRDRAARVVGVGTDGSAAQVRALLDEVDRRGANVTDFAVQRATLDDVFLALTGRATSVAVKEVTHV